MGTQGLWEYLRRHNTVKQSLNGGSKSVEYLLLDMNSVVHSSFDRSIVSSRQIIGGMLASIRELLRAFPPKKELICVFDGVAPQAKLQTQKERRKGMSLPRDPHANTSSEDPTCSACKYNLDYKNVGVQVAREELLAGSELLLACEDSLLSALADGSISCSAKFSIRGCQEVGEGELKISYAIRRIWSSQNESGTYTPDDVFAVVGNDSDLILVGIACTPYRNYFVVDPKTHNITDISTLFKHWERGVSDAPNFPELLPSYRIDFVFLMLLSGGDWFDGVGVKSVNLWRQYRDLRACGGFSRRPLIYGETFDINMDFLRSIFSAKRSAYCSRRRSKASCQGVSSDSRRGDTGLALLKGALWALKSIVTGRCVDYNFCVNPKNPSLGDLCAALKCKDVGRLIHPNSEAVLPAFSPLEQCLAVLGRRGRFSAEVMRAIKLACADQTGEKLTRSQSIPYLVEQVRLIMEQVDRSKLTLAERALLEVLPCDDDSCDSFMSFRFHVDKPSEETTCLSVKNDV